MSDYLSRQWLPVAPLLPYIPESLHQFALGGNNSIGGMSVFNKTLQQGWYRARRKGWITVGMADEICVHVLHCHPAEIYGDDWYME